MGNVIDTHKYSKEMEKKMTERLKEMNLPEYVLDILRESRGVIIPKTREKGMTRVQKY